MNIILNKTLFPKKENHIRQIFFIDAKGKTLGYLATQISILLQGKSTSFFTPGIDQGNFVIVLNARYVSLSGKKEYYKFYYRDSRRPGSLKKENVKELRNRIPTRIIEKAVYGMLPKNILGRKYYKRLYVYSDDVVNYIKNRNLPIFVKKQKN